MTIPVAEEILPLQSVEKAALYSSILALVLVLFAYPSAPVVLGLISGSVVGIFNFRFLSKFISRLVAPEATKTGFWGALLFLKMIALMAVAGVCILVAGFNAVAFAAGFSTVIIGIVYQALKDFF